MTKEWKIIVTEEGNKIFFERTNEGFSVTEILGLLELIREDVIAQLKGNRHPEIEHKARVIINDCED